MVMHSQEGRPNWNRERSRSPSSSYRPLRNRWIATTTSHPYHLGDRQRRLGKSMFLTEPKSENHGLERSLDGPLISFRQYILSQDDEVDEVNALAKYEAYKKEHLAHQADLFFQTYKASSFLRELYHPNLVILAFQQLYAYCRFASEMFIEGYKVQKFEGLRLVSENDVSVSASESHPFSIQQWIKEVDVVVDPKDFMRPPYFIQNPYLDSIKIEDVPNDISKWDIMEALQDLNGLMYVLMSEWKPTSNRSCWCRFDSEDSQSAARTNLLSVTREIKGWKVKCSDQFLAETSRAQVAPPASNHPDRVQSDIALSARLIHKLDIDSKIHDCDIAHDSNKFLNLISEVVDPFEKLDLQLLYLRRVHHVCYYSGQKYSDEVQLWEKSGPCYLRPNVMWDDVSIATEQKEWLRDLDLKLEALLNRDFTPPSPITEETPQVQTLWQNFCNEHTMDVNRDRFRCNVCLKLFASAHFVHKHLKLRHRDALEEIIEKVALPQMQSAYLSDSNRPSKTLTDVGQRTTIQGRGEVIMRLGEHSIHRPHIRAPHRESFKAHANGAPGIESSNRPALHGAHLLQRLGTPKKEFHDWDNVVESESSLVWMQKRIAQRPLISYNDL